MHDGSGHSFVGSLELAFRAGVRWGRGMRYLGMIHRVERVMNRPRTMNIHLIYDIVGMRFRSPRLKICLFSEVMGRLWCMSRRECPPLVHASNKEFVETELRARGIA